MNMDKYFMWIHYVRLHNHNKAKHNKTVCIFLGIYCTTLILHRGNHMQISLQAPLVQLVRWSALALLTYPMVSQHIVLDSIAMINAHGITVYTYHKSSLLVGYGCAIHIYHMYQGVYMSFISWKTSMKKLLIRSTTWIKRDTDLIAR